MGMENYNPPQEPWLVILYQDEHIMVVNKPSGLLSVPGASGSAQRQHYDAYPARLPAGRVGASSGYGHQRRDCSGADQSRGAGAKTPVPRT